jgi:hypothetical protein
VSEEIGFEEGGEGICDIENVSGAKKEHSLGHWTEWLVGWLFCLFLFHSI